jgi:hypothetical protein
LKLLPPIAKYAAKLTHTSRDIEDVYITWPTKSAALSQDLRILEVANSVNAEAEMALCAAASRCQFTSKLKSLYEVHCSLNLVRPYLSGRSWRTRRPG